MAAMASVLFNSSRDLTNSSHRKAMPRFTRTRTATATGTCTSYPLFSPTLPRSSLRLRAPRRHICLSASSPGGSNATDDGEGERSNVRDKESLVAQLRKVVDAYRNSNNNLRTFLQNLVDAGVVDESDVFGGDDDDLLRALIDADLPGGDPDLGVLWKLPAVAVLSFAGVPALLGYLGDAAGARVPAWMPLAYSLASFLLGLLLVVDASVSDEEWEEWARRRERDGQLPSLESEEVLWRVARRVPAAAFAASAAGEAALRAAAEVTGLDLQPPLWVAFLLFGVLWACRTGCSRRASIRRWRARSSGGRSSSTTSAMSCSKPAIAVDGAINK